jgi:hypothetical protein
MATADGECRVLRTFSLVERRKWRAWLLAFFFGKRPEMWATCSSKRCRRYHSWLEKNLAVFGPAILLA